MTDRLGEAMGLERTWGRLALGLVLTAQVAQAGVTRVLFVVAPAEPTSEREALDLQLKVTDLLAQDPRLEVVDAATRYASAETERTRRQVEQARKAQDEVAELVARLEFAEARTRAERALAELQTGDFRVLRPPYLHLLVQLARIKFALRAEDSGAAELAQALVLDPELEAPRGLNSRERTWLAAARRTAAAQPRAREVVVESSSGNGWVWLDGQLLGLAPVKVTGAKPGRHFLSFAAPGAEVKHRSELLGSVERVTFSVQPTPEGRTYRALLGALGAGFRRGEPRLAASELLAWARVDEVVAVWLGTDGSAKVVRYTAARGVPAEEVESASPQAIATVTRRVFDLPMAALAPVAATPLSAVEGVKEAEQPAAARKNRVPGIITLSAAAAAIIAGTVLVVVGQNSFHEAQQIPQVDTERYQAKLTEARVETYSGIGAFGAAAVAAGVGLWLVW